MFSLKDVKNINAIILLGFMATGKSVVGKGVAERLQLTFYDLDRLIEKQEKKSIKEIFKRDGEGGFRDIETAMLKDFLATNKAPFVLALGGGVVLKEENRKILNKHQNHIYLLEASEDEILIRIKSDNSRPVLDLPDKNSQKQSIKTLLEKRKDLYYNIISKKNRIDTTGLSVEEVVERVLKKFKEEI
jgi:shikimate kinase